MSHDDRWAIALCVSVGVGAWLAWSIPIGVLIAMGLVAAITRSRLVIVLVIGAATCAYSAHEWKALDHPLPADVNGIATLVSDPKVVNHATGVEIKIYGRHYQVWAYGASGYKLQNALAGQRVRIVGSAAKLTGVSVATYRRRHVAGSVTVESISFVDSGSIVTRSANGLRTLVSRGAKSMPATEQSLLTGFVYGDDRNESMQTSNDFQNAGLSHLLAVSGENVAFVLLLMGPVLRRFSLWGRFIGGVGVLFLFGVITRWQPSVVRAEMMAFVALLAVFRGREISKWRCLSIGSALAVVIDPFLVGSVGFLLSVSACIGMASMGEPFAERLRGSIWFRRAVAYSAAAQIGVFPVQYVVFHQISLVGLITNVLAEPIAGAVMMWGVIAGLIAGVIPVDAVDFVLHFPDTLMLWIVDTIAHSGALLQESLIGKLIGVAATVLIVLMFGRPLTASTLDQRGGKGAVGLSDQGR